jgi:hypothetical protein
MTETTGRQYCGTCDTHYEVTCPAGANVLEVLSDAYDTHATSHAARYAERGIHIRRQPSRARYRSATNPLTDLAAFRPSLAENGSQTLCGAPASDDITWTEGRFAKHLARVTCERCKDLRKGSAR